MTSAAASRLDRLRAGLGERLLVTGLANIAYLTGFETSNGALLVEPRGTVKLFTDSRYIEEAEAVAGVEAVLTTRSLTLDLATRLHGKLAFEVSKPVR